MELTAYSEIGKELHFVYWSSHSATIKKKQVAMPLPSLLFPSFQSDELLTVVCHLPNFTTEYRALLVSDMLCVWLPGLRRLYNAKWPKMTNENDRISKKREATAFTVNAIETCGRMEVQFQKFLTSILGER
jgi:hypothetical protein